MLELSPPLPILLLFRVAGVSCLNTIIVTNRTRLGPPGPQLSYPTITKETEQVYRTTWFEETGMQTVQNV
jgi:hypothetical protein